jgi:hypothetical protein
LQNSVDINELYSGGNNGYTLVLVIFISVIYISNTVDDWNILLNNLISVNLLSYTNLYGFFVKPHISRNNFILVEQSLQ